jgi:mRNA interferase MazF
MARLDPVRGHEQAGTRPVLVISDDRFNRSLANLVVALPITYTLRAIPSHVRVRPPEGGLRAESEIICEAIRSLSRERLVQNLGSVTPETLVEVEDRVRMLLHL